MIDAQREDLESYIEALTSFLLVEILTPHETTQIIQAISNLGYAKRGPDVSH